jgi:hypothetical protein
MTTDIPLSLPDSCQQCARYGRCAAVVEADIHRTDTVTTEDPHAQDDRR